VPADVLADFKKETGIDVEVTLSNNEEMISKLRATGGAGFDLAQPSQDRISGPQKEFGVYKPIDLTKIKSELFIPRCSTRRKRTRRSTARSTAFRTSGAPTGSSSTPSSRR
jgi:maltose-binding protein MalE